MATLPEGRGTKKPLTKTKGAQKKTAQQKARRSKMTTLENSRPRAHTFRAKDIPPYKSTGLVYNAIPAETLRDQREFISQSRKGIPGKWVKNIVEGTGLRETFLVILGVSSSNLSRVYRRQSLPSGQSEEILHAVRVIQQANEVWESEELALQWLRSPVGALNDSRPIDQFDTFQGRQWVSQLLDSIEHGEFT